MSNVLIVYGTTEHQTEKIAETMAAHLRELGCSVDIHDVSRLPDQIAVDDYDGVIVGASVHMARHQRAIVNFVERHRDSLSRHPSAFFSVSLSAAGSGQREKEGIQRVIEDFQNRSDWHPDVVATIAGALQYTKYNFVKRFITFSGCALETTKSISFTISFF